VIAAEAYADGLVGEAELKVAFTKAPESLLRLGAWEVGRVDEAAAATEEHRSVWALIAARDVSAPDGGANPAEMPWRGNRRYCPDTWDPAELAAQAALLRDICGNPFRPVVLDPTFLTSAVTSLAQAAHEERALPSGELDRARLAVLADALEEAGCSEQAILDHLRGPGPHVRGCWLVDLALAKE
jgi:hypothetical protein